MEEAAASSEGNLVPGGQMQSVREIQKQRWLQKKASAEEIQSAEAGEDAVPAEVAQKLPAVETPAASNAGASSSSSAQPAVSSTESAPQEEGPLKRLHVLPFAETDAKIGTGSRIEILAPELRRIRASEEVVSSGSLLSHDGMDFAVANCDPDSGPLGPDTDYFFDGAPLVSFEKIQFSCWGPEEMSTDDLFKKCLSPYFKGEYRSYGTAGAKKVRLFQNDQVFKIGEISCHVEATEPPGPCMGVVTSQTEIFANWDKQAEFEKIHIVPFQDTLPRAYEFCIFNDYLKPYLDRNKHKKMQPNDLFTFQGVQFKVVACEPPDVAARVGKATTIFCEGVLHPSLRNLLPPELLHQVAQLPPGLQMLLLSTERSTRELEDMLSHRRGLFEDTLTQLEKFEWPPTDDTTQSTCMICLCDFEDGNECRRLPCRHVFHTGCVDEWLRRCTDCPICKANVDRAIRNY